MSAAKRVNVEHRLLDSVAIQSLLAERDVSGILRRQGWRVEHSAYYVDSNEGKVRESDIVATSRWYRRRAGEVQVADLKVVVECKSIRDYHICIMPKKPTQHYSGQYEWFGLQADTGGELSRRMEGAGLSPKQSGFVLEQFRAFSYPSEASRLSRLMPPPPSPQWEASAFRETNIGNERDLDSSVIWKAGLSLESAVLSMQRVCLQGGYEMLSISTEAAMRENRDLAREAIESLEWSALAVDTFHPVLVVDSKLWRVANKGLKAIDWFRLDRPVFGGNRSFWFDVVTREAAGKYFDQLRSHYLVAFRHEKAKISRRTMLQSLARPRPS